MLKTLTNRQAASMAESCERWIDDVGLLGYACARNSRRLADATLEFSRIKNDAIREFGREVMDENGNVTAYTIDQGSSGFDAFMQRIEPFADLECSVEIMTIPAAEVIGKMSGRESLEIDWMIEEE